jgi:SAM-dependent methyltransferase
MTESIMDKHLASNGPQSQSSKSGAAEARLRSQFAARERERLERRIARYDELAEIRERKAGMRKYYLGQLQRLVGSFVMPGSRVLEIGCGFGDLLAGLPSAGRRVGIDISGRMVEKARERHPELEVFVADVEHDELPEGPFDVIVMSDVVGHLDDIQLAMERVSPLLAPGGRLVVTYYNFVWEPVLRTAERLGMKEPWPDQNWLSMDDLANILHLADFEVVRRGTDVLVPVGVPVVADVANLVGAKVPGLNQTSLVQYFIARHTPAPIPAALPRVSVICPCRNEKGNIREAVARTPVMGPGTELIFVDGNSSDGTVEEIEAVIREHEAARASAPPGVPQLELKLIHQGDGKGKGDAVRKGFNAAKYEVLMILDSDLTVPPEDLPKFYRALVAGKGEFINGVRLVYPMEGEAMRFLNLLGNKFFSLALSWLLEQPIKDSLCGTKVLYREAYDRIAANRDFFGDFDPFGDFDLLFGAARLNMKIADLPVRYRARVYGDTKISRFAHGWLLLKMTAFGFRKLRLGV